MTRHPMTVEDLWSLPRVGNPCPSPDGSRFLAPVTTYSMDTNEGTTRLWLVPAGARGAGNGRKEDPARPLTAVEASSSQAAWSPDGTRIVFVRKPGGEKGDGGAKSGARSTTKPGPKFPHRPQLYLQKIDGGEAERLTDLPLGVVDPRWFPDGKRIAFLSPVYNDALTLEKTEARAAELEGDPVQAHVTEDRFYRLWDTWLTDGKIHHLFVLDLETRQVVDLMPRWTGLFDPMEPAGHYRIAPDGKEIVFSTSKTRPPHDPVLWGVFTVVVPATLGGSAKTGTIKPVVPLRYPADTMLPVYSLDGRWIVFGLQREFDFYADRVRVVAHDRRTGKQTVLTESWDFSASELVFGDDARTLYIVAEVDARTALFALDFPAALKNPEASPPREILRGGTLGGVRVAGSRVFSNRSTVSSPPEILVSDLQGKEPTLATGFTEPGMSRLLLSETEEVYFTGAEDHRVHMTILYPPGAKKPRKGGRPSRPWPLVHMVHGGPHGVFGDQWHWRWCAQAFAAPGYAVALVNFHGSTSWGQDFTASILGRWGDQPYRDVMAATDYLIGRGIADARRVAVSGGSYGGYLVSWIASQTDRFACIVNHAGVCDFQTQYASDITQGRRRSMGGEPWDDVKGMDRYNPMRHAKGFRSPMLVIHGEKDYRVPYVQGIEIYNVYKAMGRPARLVVYPDENHWILKPRNSRHWYGEVLGWFERWLRPAKGNR